MHEFNIIKKYLSKLTLNNKNSLNLNDDVFFDRSKKLVISVDTYINKSHFYNFTPVPWADLKTMSSNDTLVPPKS